METRGVAIAQMLATEVESLVYYPAVATRQVYAARPRCSRQTMARAPDTKVDQFVMGRTGLRQRTEEIDRPPAGLLLEM